VRHSRQTCDDYAKGYPIGSSYPWGACLDRDLILLIQEGVAVAIIRTIPISPFP
jgi:hypothetical protein